MTKILTSAAKIAAIACGAAFACAAVPAPVDAAHDRETYPSPDLADLPYSAAVRAGDTIYVSGVTGHVRGKADPVPGGVRAEAEQAFAYIEEILEGAGSSLDAVVKCTVLLADINEFPALNAVFRSVFPEDPPARSTIIVPALPMDSGIEIECNAVVDH